MSKARNEIEKARRKLEGDLRCNQEAAEELEQSRNEMVQSIQRKDKELAAIAAKIEDEQSIGCKLHKQVKEIGVSVPTNLVYPQAALALGTYCTCFQLGKPI